MFYPVSQPSLTALEATYVARAVESGWVSSLGEFITAFETGFAKFVGTKHAISTANGTVALHLALSALGIRQGDEVIVPDLTFIATANAVLMCGATPVIADIDPDTLCLAPADVEKRITPRTRALVPVHLYGHPADMAALNAIAQRHNLVVIEDAAEAHGASIGSQKVGSFGKCAAFSFYGNKTLTTGEGGMVTTDDDALAERCRHLRDHAMSKVKRYWHNEMGYNYRMTNLQAALGCAQLERAAELIDGRCEVYQWYCEALAESKRIRVRNEANWATATRWLTCIEIDELDAERRELLMQRLRARGVDTRPYFFPISDMPFLRPAETPVAHAIAPTGMNLPTYLGLTRRDIASICAIIEAELSERV